MQLKQSNVDYAVQAKAAHTGIVRFEERIAQHPADKKNAREMWRSFGEALLAMREEIKSDREFGQWIKTNGLDQGPTADRIVRSNAIWFAENFDGVVSNYTGNEHHPTNIRHQCREAGYDWAGETERQKERKKKSRRTKAKKKKYSWMSVVESEGIKLRNDGRRRQKIKKELTDLATCEDLFAVENESQLRMVCIAWHAKQDADNTQSLIEEARETVKETAKEKFDKAVNKARAALQGEYNRRMEELQKSYNTEVNKAVAEKVDAMVEFEKKRAKDMFDKYCLETKRLLIRQDGIKQALNKKQFQLILNCLHPDRAPEDRKKKFSEAFDYAKKLQPYVNSF